MKIDPQKITLQQINSFINAPSIAIAGASRNEKSFSANVVQHLRRQNYPLWLINPNFGNEKNAINQLSAISQLPPNVRHLLIITPSSQTDALVQEAIDHGITHIWIQQQSETESALQLAIDNGIHLVHHECIFMFTTPTGFHKFHRNIRRLFGTLPA